VIAYGILDDAEHRIGNVRIEYVPLAEIGTRSESDGHGNVVGLLGIFRIEADEIDCLLTFQIDNPQNFPFANDIRPRLARGDDHIGADRSW
jgi:hypothetical protein